METCKWYQVRSQETYDVLLGKELTVCMPFFICAIGHMIVS